VFVLGVSAAFALRDDGSACSVVRRAGDSQRTRWTGWQLDGQWMDKQDPHPYSTAHLPPLTRYFAGSPNGIRIRVSTLRGLCPRPLDDGAKREQFRPRAVPSR
jgi:hypothetical protein